MPNPAWVKGVSGNPKGRPAGLLAARTRELRDKAKERGCDPIDVMLDTILDLVKQARKPCITVTARLEPISKFPRLKLELSNLQVLCADCNRGKGSRDTTDWRIVQTS